MSAVFPGWLAFSLFPSQRRDVAVAPTPVVPGSSNGPRVVELDKGVDSGETQSSVRNPDTSMDHEERSWVTNGAAQILLGSLILYQIASIPPIVQGTNRYLFVNATRHVGLQEVEFIVEQTRRTKPSRHRITRKSIAADCSPPAS
ncbi:hypothetical protein CC1G_14716 [Coprinopsis cinerea okayama7|uniref:Uncharacterized protein n=1 Tax=Coprinopsis cinerea (strain Okayama-7 / 130 / ATCC MYA-4618 / FGSC 9003) TaxID=240176 RepID=D6RN05_COPC7|nr:hypothetical protein CC1G_14716 [Coprinopsis cinerea okayama7\|eukprot:XP_002911287.1 hypothetical protein CC1G_14716 [Coprinopsis cinerea okayama7\